jgi:hypothetical protein
MRNTRYLGRAGTNAVKKLRLNKLRDGNPFMINSRELPAGQCYLEYPSGSIVLATLSRSGKDFDIVRELSTIETVELRKRFNLEQVSQ